MVCPGAALRLSAPPKIKGDCSTMQHHHAAAQHRRVLAACFRSCPCLSSSHSLRPQSWHPVLQPLPQRRRTHWHASRQPAVAWQSTSAAPNAGLQWQQHHQRQGRQRWRVRAETLDNSQSASQALASLDSEGVAEELLGGSQRKGAASVSAESVLNRGSQDSADSVDHHGHGHGHDHAHDHMPSVTNPVHRVLLWIYSHTGVTDTHLRFHVSSAWRFPYRQCANRAAAHIAMCAACSKAQKRCRQVQAWQLSCCIICRC